MSPSLLMLGWKQWLRKTTIGALKGYLIEKVSNSLNLSPSKTVSLGPVMVAIHLLTNRVGGEQQLHKACHTWIGCHRRGRQWSTDPIGWQSPLILSASALSLPFGPFGNSYLRWSRGSSRPFDGSLHSSYWPLDDNSMTTRRTVNNYAIYAMVMILCWIMSVKSITGSISDKVNQWITKRVKDWQFSKIECHVTFETKIRLDESVNKVDQSVDDFMDYCVTDCGLYKHLSFVTTSVPHLQ